MFSTLKFAIFIFMMLDSALSTPTPDITDITDQVTLTRDRRGDSYTASLNARAIEARGPSKDLNYNVNILTKLNSPFVFPLVISNNENVMIWLLSRQTRDSYAMNSSETQSIALYDPRSLPRNQTYAREFACLPSEDKCNQLSLSDVDVNDLGVYTFRFDTSNYLTVKTFSFNVSAYERTIEMACENVTDKSRCAYNAGTQTLSVVADEPVKLSCGIDIIQNDNYPVSANFKFISENFGEECIAETTDLLTANYQPNNATFNMIRKTLKKSCQRSFSINDISKSYSCELNPSMTSSDPTGQQTKKFESLDVKLDVQYGPDPTLSLNPISPNSIGLFNKTQMVGETTMKQKFVCPFIGNPKPTYYWRVVAVAVNQSEQQADMDSKLKTLTVTEEFLASDSQEFPIPSDLFIGSYSLECKARVDGMIEKFSGVVSFNLKMIAPPPPPTRNNKGGLNLGALIGGIFGGLALLILVVIVVIAVLRIRKNKAPKDEIEKAKDNKMGKNKPIGSVGGGNTVLSNVEEDDDEDDGGFRVAGHSEAPVPQSYRANKGLTEHSSLTQNKISDSKHSLSSNTVTHQLPILNIATLPSASSQGQNNGNPVSVGNVTLSSTTMSNRVVNEKEKFKNLNDYTTSAHEFLTQSISQNALNHIDSSNGSTKNLNSPSTSFGVYSPSTAEARHLDASAPDSNLSYAARQAKMHLANATDNTDNNFSSGTQLDLTDSSDMNTRKASIVKQQQQQQVKQQLGNKIISGLMPNPTAQAYASIAHAAAAAAQSNQQRNINGYHSNTNQSSTGTNSNENHFNTTSSTNTGSSHNLINNSNLLTNNTKSQSYSNPGFFESAPYSIQNPLESPPPYDSALHQPIQIDSPINQQQQHSNLNQNFNIQQQQQLINQQQKDYMGSNTRLISASNTPIQQQRQMNPTSHSYTVNNNSQNLSLINSTPTQVSSSLQQLQYQNHPNNNIQYTSVHNIENRARSRNPLNGPSDMENQQQYTTMAAQLSSNPIDV